jgi:hypothetical protein
MPKTILWVSRHTPTPRQLAALESHFPSHKLITDARPFDGADDIIERYRTSGADEMVLVAPDAVIRAVIARGVHPIKAEMRSCAPSHPEADVTLAKNGRTYRFIRFGRITQLHYTLEPLPIGSKENTNDEETQTIATSPKEHIARPESALGQDALHDRPLSA